MAFPVPAEFGLGPTTGSIVTLPIGAQPHHAEWVYAPRRTTGAGGAKIMGLDQLRLRWNYMSQDSYAVIMAHFKAAESASPVAFRYAARLWDDEASSGAGAYGNFVVILNQKPAGRITNVGYEAVEMLLTGIGLP